MLRALFVIAAILIGIRYSMKGPFYALLFYLWIAYFRPESWLWWDFFSALNLSLLMGIVVLVSTLLSGEKLRFGRVQALMLLLMGQSLLSVVFSEHFDYAFAYWQDFAKSTIISVLLVMLVTTEKRLRLTIVIIALSLGLEATKQGWAQLLLNPGEANHNPHPSIGDNNAVAVGMLMLVSLLLGLGRTASKRAEKILYRFMAIGVVYRAISTYSRGGFLACGAMGLHYLVRSRRKFSAAFGVALVATLIIPALPDAFWDRMNTIPTNTEEVETTTDGSTRSRIHFWKVAIEMANANPLTGVGHMAYNPSYNKYDFSNGLYGPNRSVHSSLFAILAELGYPGALLFCAIFLMAYRACRRVQRAAKAHPELETLATLGNAIERALVPFAVGGSFVIFQYTELIWHTFALSFALDRIVAERIAALDTQQTAETTVRSENRPRFPAIIPAPVAASSRRTAAI